MDFTYHIGLHCTDEDHAVRCLLHNTPALSSAGIVVADPARFRPVFQQAMLALRGAPAAAEMQEQVLDAVLDHDRPHHVLFSNHSFLCAPARAVEGRTLYPLAGQRAQWIRQVFPDRPAGFAMAIRNPATLLPALARRIARTAGDATLPEGVVPEALSWIEMVERLAEAVPECPLTLWCHEDSPLIWPQILQRLSGHPDGMALERIADFPSGLLTGAGKAALAKALAADPAPDADGWSEMVSTVLEAHAQPEAVQTEPDLPGWSAALAHRLTETYEAEVAELSARPGIRFLTPRCETQSEEAAEPVALAAS